MGIVQSLFSRIGSDRKESDKEPAVDTLPVKPATANLMILMPDAAGIAAYQQHAFVAASGAEAYLGSIFSGGTQEGAIMFWGLTWRPSDNGHQDLEAEVVILISDPSRRGLVYTFSFVDLDTAYDFVREEMKAGLDLNRTAIFWAVPAEATADSYGKITVTPSRSPTFGPAANLVAPDHQPNGTRLHSDETPTVRLPEEPASKPIDEAGITNISDILEAKVLRTSSHSSQPTDEPKEPEGVAGQADEPSDSGNGHANAGPETLHVNLGDVFGGRRDPETLTTLSDFRHSPEGTAANGLHAADDRIDAADEAVSGIIVAWSNIGAAIDRAIDAQVARRVNATIAWRNAARALRQAAESAAIRKGKGRKAGTPAQESKARVSTGSKTAMKATMKATETTRKLVNGRSKAKDAPKKATNGRSKAKDTPKKATNGRSKVKAAPKKASNGRSEAEDAPKPVAETLSAAEERAAVLDMWRSRESGRFTTKKDPFESFDSPPGRF